MERLAASTVTRSTHQNLGLLSCVGKERRGRFLNIHANKVWFDYKNSTSSFMSQESGDSLQTVVTSHGGKTCTQMFYN